ncbi:hypothetical protein C5167_032481 [Papaver somniferum]|uniref:Prolamin-like domain-containing protein n=1 Tax=Papaver somniferum TaxID=3469 RepID=A0A4Y7K9D4_PAPSO|nr:hypothetical protein C5167_032481 [Papaver somniferum]
MWVTTYAYHGCILFNFFKVAAIHHNVHCNNFQHNGFQHNRCHWCTNKTFVDVQVATPISLAARLQSDGSYSGCWDSLTELQACTGEVILFFLNGETHSGRNCCRAIHII